MPSIAGHEDSRGIAFENVYEGNPDDTDFAGNVSGCDIHRNDVGIHLLSGEIKIRGCDFTKTFSSVSTALKLIYYLIFGRISAASRGTIQTTGGKITFTVMAIML